MCSTFTLLWDVQWSETTVYKKAENAGRIWPSPPGQEKSMVASKAGLNQTALAQDKV